MVLFFNFSFTFALSFLFFALLPAIMKLSLFNYQLPKSLIAQTPAVPRDASRLLVYDKKTKKVVHDRFYNLPKYLKPDDVLVFNNSKVFPARLIGHKETGGKAEALLLKEVKAGEWEVLLGTGRPKVGLKLRFERGLEAEVINQFPHKTWLLKFNFKGSAFYAILNKIGQVPLPPYIESTKQRSNESKKQYQTIYAKHLGSAAAPTAGLHFTKKLLAKIKKIGCQTEFVTLHVGLGTFDPVKTENIEDYEIHSERVSVDVETIKRLLEAKRAGKRIIAVGTTSVRTLETLFTKINTNENQKTGASMLRSIEAKNFDDFNQNTNIFIYPGYKFQFVDAMITNFHLPKSTLLMLVSAFIDRTNALSLYKKAIRLKYRFFSFGDAMLLK